MIVNKSITTMKHEVVFDVADLGKDDINNFCISDYNNGDWEEHTFIIFDKFKDKNKVMVDMGGWLGITPLYCSHNFKHVIAFECDSEALIRLKANLEVNTKIKNISVCDKAIWNYNGSADFGSKTNGKFGDSECSMLFNSNKNTLQVTTITFLTAMNFYKIPLKDIGFIKIDIEGGEKVVIEDMRPYLETYKPTIYLSIHHHLLTKNDIAFMLDILFDIYSDVKVYNNMGHTFDVDKRRILDSQITDCVFTNK